MKIEDDLKYKDNLKFEDGHKKTKAIKPKLPDQNYQTKHTKPNI